MMRSESSNYKLGRLDKVLVLKFVLTQAHRQTDRQTDRPRYRVQDGSWPNHKKFPLISRRKTKKLLMESDKNLTLIPMGNSLWWKTFWKKKCYSQIAYQKFSFLSGPSL